MNFLDLPQEKPWTERHGRVERELPSPDLSWEYLEKKVQERRALRDGVILGAQHGVLSGII